MSFTFISKGNIINSLNLQKEGVRTILFAKRTDKEEERINNEKKNG